MNRFDVLIEIQTRDRVAVHMDVAEAVDSLLRGYPQPPEIRARKEGGEIQVEKAPRQTTGRRDPQGFRRPTDKPGDERRPMEVVAPEPPEDEPKHREDDFEAVGIFPYGVARNRLTQAAKRLRVPIIIEKDAGNAQVVVTLRNHFRNRQRTIVDAENRGTPVYVLRSNTIVQMERFLSSLFDLTPSGPRAHDEEEALRHTQRAIETVLNGERWVELTPASSYIRRLQHQMVRQANLHSYSHGKEPHRRVRIYRE